MRPVVEALAALDGLGGEGALVAALSAQRVRVQKLDEERLALQKEQGELAERVRTWEQDSTLSTLRLNEELLSQRANEQAVRYARERLALALLSRARKRFERDQQPRVVQLASATFAELTGERYARVFTSADETKDLRVLDDQGREWPAEKLSRGAREQLYLAFRLAVIEDFGETRTPLPVVLDDILVNFDPDRTRATLRVLARLSRKHQIIAFTCHPQLRDLFRKEGARVVELAEATGATAK